MLHSLEEPIPSAKKLGAAGAGLYANLITAESFGGKFDVVSDSKTGTFVRISLPRYNGKKDSFKPVKKESLEGLEDFTGQQKPA